MFGSMKLLNALAPWQWALAAAVPIGILALYFLKLRRKALVVPSTFLWKRSVEDLHVNSLLQRLRSNILLLLQLLAAAAAIFALAHPTINAREDGKFYIIAVDHSASMSAVEADGQTRLQSAQSKAIEFLNSLGNSDNAMAIAFDDSARVLCSYTNNKNAVIQAVRAITPTAKGTHFADVFRIASGLANPVVSGGDIDKQEIFAQAQPATLYVYSDGRFPPLGDVTLGRLEVRYRPVGKIDANVAITNISAKRVLGDPDRVEVFALVRNFGTEPVETTAALQVDGRETDLQNIRVSPGGDQGAVFRVPVGDAATLCVHIKHVDALPADNSAWAVVEPPRKARIAVLGPPNPVLKSVFTTQGMALIAEVDFFTRAEGEGDLREAEKFNRYDLMVFDGFAPKEMPACNTMLIGAVPPSLSDRVRRNEKAPAILNWNVEHPVLRFLALDNVFILEAFTLEEVKGSAALLETNRGAVIFTLPRGVHTDLVQTFRILDDEGAPKTDWPSKPSFPLYVMNAVTTMSGIEREGKQSLAAGEPAVFRGGPERQPAVFATPSGESRTVQASRNGDYEFFDTESLGVYTVKIGEIRRRFAVNLCNAEESNIKPEELLKVGQEQVAADASPTNRRRELWKWLAAAAFIVILFEWYVYNRRVQL